MVGGVRLSTSATPSSTATPEPPSLAPGTGLVESVEVGESVVGRLSQWARNRRRFSAAGLKRATKLVSGSESPASVTWVHDWTISVSARWRSRLSSHAAWRRWASEPGRRGPNATWASM